MKRLLHIARQNRVTLIFVALFLLILGFILVTLRRPATELHLEAIRRQGYPATLAELDAWYPAVPDSENAALVYSRAFAWLNVAKADASRSLAEEIVLPKRGQKLPPEDRAKLSSLLASNQTSLELMHSAVSFSRSRYSINFNPGYATLLPHLAEIRKGVVLLSAEATLRAEEGETDAAVASLVAAGHLADSLSAEPMTISQSVRTACWNIILSRLEYALNLQALGDEPLGRLQNSLALAKHPECLARALGGERCLGLAAFSDPARFFSATSPGAQTGPGQLGQTAGLSILKLTGIFQKDRDYFLGVLATNIGAAELPYPERLQIGRQAAALTQVRPNRFCIFSSIFLPGLGKVYDRDATFTARLRVAQTVLAVERFRQAQANSLPSTLEQLVPAFLPAVPTDPFDGQPLRFRKLDSGYVIYSIGSDGVDDGGVNTDSTTRSTTRDVAFTIER